MINEVDIKDWQMLTEPLQLKELKTNDVFSFEGCEELLHHHGKLGNTVIAGILNLKEISIPYTLPDFLKVYKWQKRV